MKEGFNRMNFFKGFFTQAEDWQAAQEYHLEKRKLHNKFLHTPGVVFGCLSDLRVTAREQGTSLYVAPGYAINGEGQDLYLPKPEEISIVPSNYQLPTTVYVVIKYNEKKVDKRQNTANPEHSDFAFISELPLIEIIEDKPDNHNVIELARIDLSANAVRVTDARDPDNPGADEINLKFIEKAGVAKKPVSIARGNLGERIKNNASVTVTSEDTASIPLETAKGSDLHRFYLVSAYPDKESAIQWHIESRFQNGSVAYQLHLKNLSEEDVKVTYTVYRV